MLCADQTACSNVHDTAYSIPYDLLRASGLYSRHGILCSNHFSGRIIDIKGCVDSGSAHGPSDVSNLCVINEIQTVHIFSNFNGTKAVVVFFYVRAADGIGLDAYGDYAPTSQFHTCVRHVFNAGVASRNQHDGRSWIISCSCFWFVDLKADGNTSIGHDRQAS